MILENHSEDNFNEIGVLCQKLVRLSIDLIKKINSKNNNNSVSNTTKLIACQVGNFTIHILTYSLVDSTKSIEDFKYLSAKFSFVLETVPNQDIEETFSFYNEWVGFNFKENLNAFLHFDYSKHTDSSEPLENIEKLLSLFFKLFSTLNLIEFIGKRKESGIFVKEGQFNEIKAKRRFFPLDDSSINSEAKISNLKENVFESILQHLKKGYFLFENPEVMKVGVKKKVLVSISESIELLREKYFGKEFEEIKIAQVMQLKLKGENFEIESLNNDTQILDEKNITSWTWNVKPLKSGSQQLILLISAKLKLSATGSDMQDIVLEEKTIIVHVNPIYSISKFLSKNWQWLIGTLVGSGITVTILKLLKIIN